MNPFIWHFHKGETIGIENRGCQGQGFGGEVTAEGEEEIWWGVLELAYIFFLFLQMFIAALFVKSQTENPNTLHQMNRQANCGTCMPWNTIQQYMQHLGWISRALCLVKKASSQRLYVVLLFHIYNIFEMQYIVITCLFQFDSPSQALWQNHLYKSIVQMILAVSIIRSVSYLVIKSILLWSTPNTIIS